MLADLRPAVARRLRANLLCVDGVGYLSDDSRYADLLFEVVTRRYDAHRPLLPSTNKAFSEWSEVFPHAACVVTLVDRLIHRAEVIEIDADSYRLKGIVSASDGSSLSECRDPIDFVAGSVFQRPVRSLSFHPRGPRFRVRSCRLLRSRALNRRNALASCSARGTTVGASFPCAVAVITDGGTAGPSARGLHAVMASDGQEVLTNEPTVAVACTPIGKHATGRACAKCHGSAYEIATGSAKRIQLRSAKRIPSGAAKRIAGRDGPPFLGAHVLRLVGDTYRNPPPDRRAKRRNAQPTEVTT